MLQMLHGAASLEGAERFSEDDYSGVRSRAFLGSSPLRSGALTSPERSAFQNSNYTGLR